MKSSKKAQKALLAPWRKTSQGIEVFLQKRSKTAKSLPNHFGFWGGGVEKGETPEAAMLRELQEELTITPSNYIFVGKFEFDEVKFKYDGVVKYLWCMRVSSDFESTIDVREGQYGKFFTRKDIDEEPMFITQDRPVLKALFSHIEKSQTKLQS